MKYKIYIIIVLSMFTNAILAQDPIFTQYYLVPQTQNASFTGTINTLNAGVLHRTQWPDGSRQINTDYAYLTGSLGNFSEDFRPNDSNLQNIGVGLSALNQHEVFTGYNYLQINGVTSLNLDLDNIRSGWRMVFGLEGGYGNKNFNSQGLLFEDQINTDNGSISGGSSDPYLSGLKTKINFFDLSSGFLLYNDDFWLGASIKHLTKPNITFSSEGYAPLDMSYNIQTGYGIDLQNSPGFSFLPDGSKLVLTSNFMKQGEYNRFDFGSMVHFNPFIVGVIAATNPMTKSSNSQMLTSLNLIGSMQLGKLIFGYSYDLNTSKFGNSGGIHEFSLTWQIGRECYRCNNYLVKRPWGRNYDD